MKLNTRKGIRVGLVAGLVVTGLVGVTSLTASGTGAAAPVSYGTLTITLTDRAGSLTLVRPGVGTFTQPLTVGTPCSTVVTGAIAVNLDPPNPPNPPVSPLLTDKLLTFGASVNNVAANVQLPSNGIGVTDGINCAGQAGTIGLGETLTVDLGNYLPTKVTVQDGTLRIGKTRASDGDVFVSYDGVNNFPSPQNPPTQILGVGVTDVPVRDADGAFRSISIRSSADRASRGLSLRSTTVFNLVTPAPATVPGAPTGVSAVASNAQAAVSWTPVPEGSNGGSPINGYQVRYAPDSLNPSWTEVTLPTGTATTQTVPGLQNGTAYIFQVRARNIAVGLGPWSTSSSPVTPWTDLVGCGDNVPADATVTGSIANSAVFFRGENGIKAEGSTCANVGVVIEIQAGNATDPGKVFWNNSNIGLDRLKQDVQGTVTIEWAPVDPAAPGNLAREIDYDADGIGDYTTVLWCKSFSKSTNTQTGAVTLTAEQPLLPSDTPGANADGTAPWCLVSNVETLTNGQITQTQVYYGSGDPWAR